MTSVLLASESKAAPAILAGPSGTQRVWRRLRADRKVSVGLAIVLVLAFIAVLGPVLTPYDPASDEFELFAEPSRNHILGTDSFGRDILSRMIAGTRVSFSVGIAVAILSMVIGVLLGLVAGYFGGWLDSLIMRFMDLLWAFPVIILAVGMMAIFGAGIRNIIIAITAAYIDDFARVVHAEVLRHREEDYALAAKAIGAPHSRIMGRHILPNILAPIIVQGTFVVGLGILAESSLTFLGLGVSPSTPTWGLILNEGRDFIRQAWWISVFPGLAIMVTVLGLNLLGDGLRDSMDVRGVD